MARKTTPDSGNPRPIDWNTYRLLLGQNHLEPPYPPDYTGKNPHETFKY